jgi:hypothetical protein
MWQTLRVLALTVLVGCQSSLPLAPADTSDSQGFELASKKSSKVFTPTGTGSCFPITDDAYLTAAHVVSDTAAYLVTINGGCAWEIIFLEGLDAAVVVMMNPHGQEPWSIDPRFLEPAEDLYLSGWGAGRHWWSRGLATESQNRASISITFGDSGCPLMDADGDVVGLIVAVGVTAKHHAWFIPMRKIVAALPEDILEDIQPPRR